MTYKQALGELEKILEEINNDDVDIDLLAKKIERASELIKYCKAKLRASEEKIQGILSEEVD